MNRANAKNIVLFLLACQFLPALASAQLLPDSGSPAEERWVQRFMKAYESGRMVEGVFDEQRFKAQALKTYQLNAKQQAHFDDFNIGKQLIERLHAEKSEFTYLRFLRARSSGGMRKAIFRFTGPTGLSYLEFFLTTQADGEVIAWDCEPYVSGERLSLTLRRLWAPTVAQLDPMFKKHMGKRAKLLAENLLTVGKLSEAKRKGEYENGIRIYNTLPPLVQEELACMLSVMQCYLQLERYEDFDAINEKYKQLHGSATNQELLSLDAYFMAGRYEDAMQVVDALDVRVGGDPYLNMARANLIYMQDDYAKAQRLYDACLAWDPTMGDFYVGSIDIALVEEDWPRVTQMLFGLAQQGIELGDLEADEAYEGYVQTDEYKKWKATGKSLR